MSASVAYNTNSSLGPQVIPDAQATVDGPQAWAGDDFKGQQSYVLQLSSGDIQEVDSALGHFKSLSLTSDGVSQTSFPLSSLKERFENATKSIHQGHGFFVVKGLGSDNFSVEDSLTVYLGIASYIGDQRGRQDKKGNMLTHITSAKHWKVPVDQRHGIHSDRPLPFHNDMGCDILGLQAREAAREGGFTYLSSAATVFNNLLTQEPDVVKALLTSNWPVQISGRDASHYLAPAFAIHDGKVMTSMDPNRFGPHPSYTGTIKPPTMTPEQLHAIQRVTDVAHEVELALRLEQGDLLFFNNWALLHRRDAYRDDLDSSRHLIRLWLRNSELGWDVPESMLPPWAAAYGPNPSVKERLYALHPEKEYTKPKYTAGSAAFLIEDTEEAGESSGKC